MAFYSGRHRTICAVLEEISSLTTDGKILSLCAEATNYAKRMSLKLGEHKAKEYLIDERK